MTDRTSNPKTLQDQLRELAETKVFNNKTFSYARQAMRLAANRLDMHDMEIDRIVKVVGVSREALGLPTQVETTTEPEWTREVGWVVENGEQGEKLRYRTMEQGMATWTADHLKALRFARRADAEMFSQEDEDAWRIAEHIWSGPAVKTSAEPDPRAVLWKIPDEPAGEECPMCKGVGQIGIPGAICRVCKGTGHFQLGES